MTAVWASPDVVTAMHRVDRLGTEFVGRVMSFMGIRRQGGAEAMLEGARQEMEQARKRETEAIDELERIMRDELAKL